MSFSDSNKTGPHKILIVAAESSSCLYAERLLQWWKKQDSEIEAFGIGNRDMEREGFECLARAEDLAVVGIQEVVSQWSVIKKAFNDLIAAVEKRRPEVVLLMDYSGFNLRFAKRMKALNVPVVYYISPQVWASRPGRVETIRNTVAKMLVIYPFEKEFYKTHQMEVEFVGHPLLDELNPKHFDAEQRAFRRHRYGINEDDLVLALMPGSRRSELKHHMEVQLTAARRLVQRHPRLKIALLVAPNFSKEDLQVWLAGLDFPLMLIKDEPFSMIDLADVVLCASGTATLMVGLLEKPMVVMYRMNPLTAFLAKRIVTSTKYFALINLVLDEKVVEELFQEQASPEGLVAALEPLIASRETRTVMADRLRAAKDRLGTKGATPRVAEILQKFWRK
jgi:lipid-A-disaccharide synthase